MLLNMKRFLWLIASVFGTAGLVWVVRYQPKPVSVGKKVAVGSKATPVPDSPAAASTPTPTVAPTPSITAATRATPTPAAPKASATPKPTAAPTAAPTPTPTPRGLYAHDGSFTGNSVATNPYFGQVQVKAVISNGYITNVVFLQMPSGGNSSFIASQAEPILLQETLQAQSANINTVSGATQDTEAYKSSLSSALSQA